MSTPSNKRFLLGALVLTAVALLAQPAGASAASPWWQVLTGSRPTNMWEPEDNVQEIKTGLVELGPGEEGMATRIRVEGKTVGCLGTASFAATCESQTGFAPAKTASELEATLETAFGTPSVEVTGGPVGGAPFVVTTPERAVPFIGLNAILGTAKLKILSEGGSGRLVLTATNLGDAPVDATSTPVTIVDELPEGVEATRIEAFAGTQGQAGEVDCEIEAGGSLVSCTFEEILDTYDTIEVEILANLTGKPPVAGAPGKVTVSGGNAPTESAVQTINIDPGKAPFGFEYFSGRSEEEGGGSSTEAGSHPFQLTTTIQFNGGRLLELPGAISPPGRGFLLEQPALPRNFRFPLPAGLVGNAKVMPQCSMADFFDISELINTCPDESAVGVVAATVIERINLGLARLTVPVFNLPPALGEPARFGFVAGGVTVVIDTAVDPEDQYRIIAKVNNTTQVGQILASTVVIWGRPGDPLHDNARGWNCVYDLVKSGPCVRPPGLEEPAFLRLPVSCVTPFDFDAEIEPWNVPLGSVVDTAHYSAPKMGSCDQVPLPDPTILSAPTSKSASSSSGLDFQLEVPNKGLLDPEAKDEISEGQAKKVEVSLPEGMTVNPSQAEGLGACSPADYARETVSSLPGQGCPDASKVGTVEVKTPLIEEEVKGSLYVAKPFDNPFDSLLALYMVARVPERGILVKQAGEVALDPNTGRIVSTFDNLPQVPFDTFKLHFFPGDRAPLVMPPKCGTYEMVAKFYPWSAADPDNPLPEELVTEIVPFEVDQGPGGAPCPSGTPPFKPGFTAGTTSNVAGSYSPLTARLTRSDGEQEFSRFSIKLPKGLIGSLAGVQFCPEAGIAAAKARTGPNGGQEELDNPSCPAASQIGRVLVGAGVGSALTYTSGKIYLAGPYQGSKLSIVAVATAKVGPFDLGTVVIRQALKVDSETAEVTAGAESDPIPRVLKGVVTHIRDIRVFVDRPNFVLNPTNCEPMTVGATVLGSGLDLGSSGDDQAVDVSAPFQAADCANLGFKPKLSLKLLGGTKRGDTPRLRAVLNARPGDANIGRAQVTLPRSAFLEQAHIRTVCTRVQFRAGAGNGEQCPKGAVYGKARAISPLLDEPLEGPVFLRSSDNELPDLVAALHSDKVDFNLVGRIDSLNGRIRNTFEGVPDAPVTKFVLEMQGGKKGLIVNSTNICRGKLKAIAAFRGQNGRRHFFKPVVKAKCKKGGKGKGKGGKGGGRK